MRSENKQEATLWKSESVRLGAGGTAIKAEVIHDLFLADMFIRFTIAQACSLNTVGVLLLGALDEAQQDGNLDRLVDRLLVAGRPLGAGEPFRPAVAGLATEALCQAFYQYTILAREQVRSGDVPRDDEYPDWEEWQAGYLDTEFEGLKVGDRIKLASEGEIVYGHGGLAIRFDDTPPNVRPEPLDGQYLGLLRRVAR